MLYLRDANLPTTPVYSCSFLMRNMSTIRWSTTSLFLIMLLANSLFSYRQSLSTSSVLVLPEQLVSLSTGWLNLSANIDYRLVRRLKTPVMETLYRCKNFCKSKNKLIHLSGEPGCSSLDQIAAAFDFRSTVAEDYHEKVRLWNALLCCEVFDDAGGKTLRRISVFTFAR